MDGSESKKILGIKEQAETVFREFWGRTFDKEAIVIERPYSTLIKIEQKPSSLILRQNLIRPSQKKHAVIPLLFNLPFKVPAFIPTAKDEMFVKKGSFYFELSNYIEGKTFSGSLQEIESSAKNLSLLHKVPCSLPLETKRTKKKERLISLAKKHRNAYSKLIAFEKVLEISNYLTELHNSGPLAICHLDWTPGNLLFQAGELTGVIDFETSQVNYAMRDFYLAMHKTTRFDRPSQEILKERVKTFIQGYGSVNLNNMEATLKKEVALKLLFILEYYDLTMKKASLKDMKHQLHQYSEIESFVELAISC